MFCSAPYVNIGIDWCVPVPRCSVAVLVGAYIHSIAWLPLRCRSICCYQGDLRDLFSLQRSMYIAFTPEQKAFTLSLGIKCQKTGLALSLISWAFRRVASHSYKLLLQNVSHLPGMHLSFSCFFSWRCCIWSSPSSSCSGHASCPFGSGICSVSSTLRCPCRSKPNATSTTWRRAWRIPTAASTLFCTRCWPRTTRSTWGSTIAPGQQAATLTGAAFSVHRGGRRLLVASSARRASCSRTLLRWGPKTTVLKVGARLLLLLKRRTLPLPGCDLCCDLCHEGLRTITCLWFPCRFF